MFISTLFFQHFSCSTDFYSSNLMFICQVYSRVTGVPKLPKPYEEVSSLEFYGVGYDDSDRRIPDMALIQKQLGE